MLLHVTPTGAAKHAFDQMSSTSPENILGDQVSEYTARYLAFCRSLGYPRSVVTIHKAKLGKQAYTHTGEFRFWVWEKVGLWRVFVSDIKGICFEVPENFNANQALKAFYDYLSMMGFITDNYVSK